MNILGAGQCGTLLATMLAPQLRRIDLYERGRDPRDGAASAGRSINLALAARGIRALEAAKVMPRVKPLLIGDAAHAVVPFHGQGMNLAFEDCVLLEQILRELGPRWAQVFARYESIQMTNANAIADMALENYVEMRDTVRDPKFALQKALAFELERRLPDRFIPRYSMVMFHAEIPYRVAKDRGAIQQSLLEQLTRNVDHLEQIDLDAATATVCAQLGPL